MPGQLKYALLHEDGSLTSKVTSQVPVSYVGHVIFDRLTTYGNRPLFVDGPDGKVHSASQVKDLVTKLALGLLDLGVKEEDVIFGFCPNSVIYGSMILAVPSIGATFTGCQYTHPKMDFYYQANGSGAKVILCSNRNMNLAMEVADGIPSVKFLINMDGDQRQVTPMGKFVIPVNELINRKSTPEDAIIPLTPKKLPCEAIAFIFYSSGSTGPPKGVLRTHINTLATTMHSPFKTNGVSGYITCHQPIPHVSGVATTLYSAYDGNLCVYNDGFQVETFLASVAKHRIMTAFLAPSAIISLVNQSNLVKSFDLSSLIYVGTGGAPLPQSVVPSFKQLFKSTRLVQFYASTESGSISTVPDEVSCTRTCGIPQPHHRIKIVNQENGEALGPNQVGEIYDQSSDVSIGYLNRPVADKENFTSDKKWLKTGDAGYFDEDGLLYIVDRYKEVIKVDSQQVAPSELESILLSHESVCEAAVIGIPDNIHGEIPFAFVVVKADANMPTPAEIVNFVNQQVAKVKRIRGIKFIHAIPKISLGKIDRMALKKYPELVKSF